MKLKIILISFILAFANCHCQPDSHVSIVTHQVQMGETVKTISKKYLSSPSEIYKLNKFAIDGVSAGMVLQIPVPHRQPKSIPQETLVQHNNVAETIAEPMNVKEVSITVAESKKPKNKPVIAESKTLDNNSETQENAVNLPVETPEVSHLVVANETLYSLAKQYGTTVDNLKAQNPFLEKKGLQIGQKIQFKK